eukprot:gene12793-16052_t
MSSAATPAMDMLAVACPTLPKIPRALSSLSGVIVWPLCPVLSLWGVVAAQRSTLDEGASAQGTLDTRAQLWPQQWSNRLFSDHRSPEHCPLSLE